MRTTALLALALIGCSSYDAGLDAAQENFDTDAGADFPDAGDDDDDFEPPEEEDDFLALAPAQTDVHVFVANPGRDTVTRINVASRAVDTTSVGRDPRVVLTDPGYSYAAVLNFGDSTVTLLDSRSLDKETVEVREGLNRMVMSPDGSWLVLWYDPAAVDPDDPPRDGLISFNEISFVHVDSATHYPMVVGANPHGVRFTPDSALAVIVADESLAMVPLVADDDILERDIIAISPDPLEPPPAEEVEVSPDGRFAFVRQFGADELAIVDIQSKVVDRVPVGENPTDLDLTPDGATAAVVARTAKEIWLFDTTDPFSTPDVLDIDLDEDVDLGSVLFDPIGDTAILYTTAQPVARYATWDLGSDTITLRGLEKPVDNVAITPTGESMVVFHSQEDASDADPFGPFYGKPAITPVSLVDFASNPLRMPAEISGYANATNGNFGFFILEDQPFLEILDYRTLLHEDVRLKSNPVYIGVLPDLDLGDSDEPPAWVSQEHELGRITFYDADDGSLETLTGFELNSHIED